MAFDGEAPRAVPDISYSENPLLPGKRYFACTAYRASLSTESCADRWAKAQDAKGEPAWSLAACRTCSIGSVHAGRGRVHYSAHYRTEVCARCGRGGMRMIGGRVCVSCYNREREIRLGKNARGNKPVELLQKPPRRVELMVEVDGEAERLVERESSGMAETIVRILQGTKGKIAFGFSCAEPACMARLRAAAAERHRQLCRYRAGLFTSAAAPAGGAAWARSLQ